MSTAIIEYIYCILTVFCYSVVNMDKEIINYNRLHDITVINTSKLTEFPSHWHNAAEFTVVFKDGCRYRIGDKIYEADAGDVVLIWPSELHEILHVPVDGSMFIQFSASLIENNTDLASALRLLNACHVISHLKEPDLASKITSIIYKIRDNYNNKEYFTETRCKLLIYEILLDVGEYVIREQKKLIGADNFSDRSWDYIRKACSFISEHSSEDITQSEVAETIGISSFYFSKLFNEYTGMSFPEYLSGIRVQTAINLLLNEELSITDCAFQAGFQSSTRFNKVFRDITGFTPREYRKLHRTNV